MIVRPSFPVPPATATTGIVKAIGDDNVGTVSTMFYARSALLIHIFVPFPHLLLYL
jgi:hypothetical protein